MKELSVCPLCRAALPPSTTVCVECGAALEPYLELHHRVEDYLRLADELISQGAITQAAEIAAGLALFTEDYAAERAGLHARLALERNELEVAAATIGALPAGRLRSDLEALLELRRTARLRGCELYNSALTQARSGNPRLAAQLLQRAVAVWPDDPALWLLKLKADLKTGNYSHCYTDLSALDRLGARPREFTHLEQLLPPVTRL